MRRIWSIGRLVAVTIMVSLLVFQSVLAESRPPARNIPDKTLIVGTHLISLDAINAEILNIASVSAQKSGQLNVYFKSDINKGAWYDITDGGNITRIAISTDNLVTEEIIDALKLTHYTKPSGQTVEFESGKIISVNNIEGINFPPNLPELEEVVKEAEALSSILAELDEEDESRGIYSRAFLSASWVLQLINDSVFMEYTSQLDRLDGFIFYLRNEKRATSAAVELAIEEKMYISAARELYIYGVVEGKINSQLDALNYLEQSALIGKYSSALTNMQAHMLELAASLKGEPANSLEKVYQKYSAQMNSSVFAGNNESAYTSLLKMNALNNLRTGTIEDKLLEIEAAREVKKDIMQKLARELNSGGGNEYRRAVRGGERRDILEKLKQDDAAQFTLYTDELNAASNYIVIRTDSVQGKAREAAETAEAYSSMLEAIPDTDMKGVLSASLSLELEAAAENAADLKLAASEEYNAAKAEVESLAEEVSDLNEKYLGAIEENDGGAEGYADLRNKALAALDAAEARLKAVEERVMAREELVVNTAVFSGFEGVLEDAGALKGRLTGLEASGGLSGLSVTTGADEELSEIIAATGAVEELAEIIAAINNLGDGGLSVDASVQEATDALNSLIASLRQQDFKGQARALSNALNNAAAKVDSNQRLAANDNVKALRDNIGEMADSAQGLLNAGITPENEQKLAEMKSNFEELGPQLSSAVEEALPEPAAIPAGTADRAGEDESRSDAAKGMKLIFTDYDIKLSTPVVTIGKEILVPAEELSRQMGASFIREKAAGRIVIKDKGVLIEFRENDKYIYINDRRETFNPTAQSVNGRLYIPLSCIERAYRLVREEVDGNIVLSKR